MPHAPACHNLWAQSGQWNLGEPQKTRRSKKYRIPSTEYPVELDRERRGLRSKEATQQASAASIVLLCSLGSDWPARLCTASKEPNTKEGNVAPYPCKGSHRVMLHLGVSLAGLIRVHASPPAAEVVIQLAKKYVLWR